jgi:hypothetical protein
MDEKELIERTKNSMKAKKSQAEILGGFQKRGYKLAYADEIIKKANRPKKLLVLSLLFILIAFFAAFTIYTLTSGGQKLTLTNPLTGYAISGQPTTHNSQQIEITPEFVTYLLNEIGAYDLHKNPLTRERPIINFKIEDKNFHSIIGNNIETSAGLSDKADIQLNTNKQQIIDAVSSQNPRASVKASVQSGATQIDLKTSETELFAKGYLKLYNALK